MLCTQNGYRTNKHGFKVQRTRAAESVCLAEVGFYELTSRLPDQVFTGFWQPNRLQFCASMRARFCSLAGVICTVNKIAQRCPRSIAGARQGSVAYSCSQTGAWLVAAGHVQSRLRVESADWRPVARVADRMTSGKIPIVFPGDLSFNCGRPRHGSQ